MSDKAFTERLGYLASSGLREDRHKQQVDASYNEGYEAGVLAQSESDDCPYDPDRRCSDHTCDGC